MSSPVKSPTNSQRLIKSPSASASARVSYPFGQGEIHTANQTFESFGSRSSSIKTSAKSSANSSKTTSPTGESLNGGNDSVLNVLQASVSNIARDLSRFAGSGSIASASIGATSLKSSASNKSTTSSVKRRSSSLSRRPSAAKTFLSTVEEAMLRAEEPMEIDESQSITVIGNYGVWVNREEVQNWKGQIPIEDYLINEDASPEVITKKSKQQIDYVQELAIRYLRPPTPPAPGEIVITQLANFTTGPAPPLIIRQQPPRPETPEPLVIREMPPQLPMPVGIKKITISGKQLPPPPRKVIIERLAALPPKPQAVLIERWLPYSQVKRRVIFNRPSEKDAVIVKPRNIIVQWEAPQVQIKKEYKYLGVITANPAEYVQTYGTTLKQSVELPEFVREIPAPDGLTLAADYKQSGLLELEGDLHALKLIDLDAEGLGEYSEYVKGIPSVAPSRANSIISGRSKSSAAGSRTNSLVPNMIPSVVGGSSSRTTTLTSLIPNVIPSVSMANSRTTSVASSYLPTVIPSVIGNSRTTSIASSAVKSQATVPMASRTTSIASTYLPRASVGSTVVSAGVTASHRDSHGSFASSNIQNLAASASSSVAGGSRVPSNASGSFLVTASVPMSTRTTSIAKSVVSTLPVAAHTSSIHQSTASVANSGPVAASRTSSAASTITSLTSSKQRKSSISSLVEQIFHTINRNHSGGISIEDAEKALLRLNSRLGRRYGEDDVIAFFSALDKNQDGTLDFEEFKSAFENIVI